MPATKEISEGIARKNKRPTSPHLSIYKPQITSVLSISHRLTGVALFFALSIISWWIIYFVFFGPCKCVLYVVESQIFTFALQIVSVFATYHFLNGIRHLFWDIGWGFSLCSVNYSGWLVVTLTILITFVLWSVVL
ncbi:MAG: succinate dehydrogenase, cytochrome b556 subunit [Rickettsiaceae bacterium]|nr:succinate dehydrogenase, cytochrome b556 subunit [Rickettsiaceae bacterium]